MAMNGNYFFKRVIKAALPYSIIKIYRKYKKGRSALITTLPTKVRLEATTLCQLRCTACPMFSNSFLGKDYLKIADFEKFIQNNRYVKEIELSNKGEIFLNPDLFHIIKHAFENNVKLTAGNGVNFNSVSDEIIEALVKYQFRFMSVSIDGASQEIYSMYRVNGDFNTVIENIKKLNACKKKYNSKFPMLK